MGEPTNERPRGALALLAAVFAAAGLWFVVGSDAADAPVVRGARAPGFDLPRFVAAEPASGAAAEAAAGAGRLALEELAGRVVLVNFWATWCEPCEQEMPAMERLYRALPRERFELVAISIDDEPGEVGGFVERYSLTFPILLDPQKQVSVRYQTMGVPESLLVDREGRIVERYVGPREWDAPEYVARIEALFAAGSEAGAGDPTPPTDARAAAPVSAVNGELPERRD